MVTKPIISNNRDRYCDQDFYKGARVIIGGYGRFWDRKQVDWSQRRLLGHDNVGRNDRKAEDRTVVDFGWARGVYVLYHELGIYYAGLCKGDNGLGARLADHNAKRSRHHKNWTHFSWFSVDSPDFDTPPDRDNIYGVDRWRTMDLSANDLIMDLEALLIAAMRPLANSTNPKFRDGGTRLWTQVANARPIVDHIDEYRTY